MKRVFLLTWFIIIFSGYTSFSQEYNYTNYNVTDGLAGSTVYCITQDKDGFMWMGTETGVSRFDGTHFKNFTTVDGLPDIEVLQMFGDAEGRVWMAPFRKSVCYQYHGKIYNQDNDSLLKKIDLKGNVEHFAEDGEGNIMIQEETALHLVTRKGRVYNYDSIGDHPISESFTISRSISGHFWVQQNKMVYEFVDGRFIPLLQLKVPLLFPGFIAISPQTMIWRKQISQTAIKSLSTGKTAYFHFEAYHFQHISYSIIDDSLIYFNESTGSTEYNFKSGITRKFLPGIETSSVFRDDEGNTWFTTIGRGVFRLNSDKFRNLRLQTSRLTDCEVESFQKTNNELVVGSNRNFVFRFSLPGLKHRVGHWLVGEQRNRVMAMEFQRNGDTTYGTDMALEKFRKTDSKETTLFLNVKNVCRKNDRELFVASSKGAFLIDLADLRIKDTLFMGRTTTVYYKDDAVYVGTLNGLYRVNKDKSIDYLGAGIPFFRKRISSVTASGNGILWVAAYDDAGVAGYRNGKIVATIASQQGLTSNICRTILVHDSILWVGTDKGLNKVDLNNPGYPVTRFTSADGLGSDIINTLYVDNSTVYVGTAAGLSFFDETSTNPTAGCRLALLSVINSGKERIADTAALQLPYTGNNIHFEFAGISYRSSGNITYRYRLVGVDTTWKETKETYLDYPTLPSGNYSFQLQAINKYGIRSTPLRLPFTVTTPFWRTPWFFALILLTFLSLTWLFVSLRIRAIRWRQQEKEELSKKIFEMEHMALRTQMNPHFIFNCLNSIQQYIFDQDIFAANKYIAGFAKLIRATLQHSSQSYITLDDEITYLSNYLSLEKLRFKDKMDYIIEMDPSLTGKEFLIPPMLIQPYVENCMRHGLRHKTDGKGLIRLNIQPADAELVFIIEDNGIGREKASQYKTREHIEYQSRGMTLTADRIRLIKTAYGKSIEIEIIDLKDEQGRATGTRVVMQFPKIVDNQPKKDPL